MEERRLEGGKRWKTEARMLEVYGWAEKWERKTSGMESGYARWDEKNGWD